MTTLAYVALLLVELIAVIGWLLWFHERGYRKGREEGYAKGYSKGRLDEAACWVGMKVAVDEEQKKLWRAHPLSGKGYRPDEWREWP